MKNNKLLEVLEFLREIQHESEKHYHTFKVAQREAIFRKLIPEVENWRVIDDFPNF